MADPFRRDHVERLHGGTRAYGVVITRQWVARGFADTVTPQLLEFIAPQPVRSQSALAAASDLPPWLGWEPLHRKVDKERPHEHAALCIIRHRASQCVGGPTDDPGGCDAYRRATRAPKPGEGFRSIRNRADRSRARQNRRSPGSVPVGDLAERRCARVEDVGAAA